MILSADASLRHNAVRAASLPYSIPDNLPRRPIYTPSTTKRNLLPRFEALTTRSVGSSKLSGGIIALIVILVVLCIASLAVLAYFMFKRRQNTKARPFTSISFSEKPQPRAWSQYGGEWFGRKSFSGGEDTQRLVSYSRMPSITISQPHFNSLVGGSNSVFHRRDQDSLGSNGITELPAGAPSPEAIYDPYTRSRSRSRSPTHNHSLQSSPTLHESSTNTTPQRSRNSSMSSTHSRSPSYGRVSRPLAQNSYSYARTRSSSNGANTRIDYAHPSTLPETDEEYNSMTPRKPTATQSAAKSKRPKPKSRSASVDKSLPPLPLMELGNNSLTYIPTDPTNWRVDPYTNLHQQAAKRQQSERNSLGDRTSRALNSTFGFQVQRSSALQPTPAIQADTSNLVESDSTSISLGSPLGSQVIDIAIAGPLDIPQGPLTPFGEREAKAGAAFGLKSAWYTSPGSVERGNWLV